MKAVMLSKGMMAVVDDEDFAEISKFKWYAQRPRGKQKRWYAVRGDGTMMHRLVLGLAKGDERQGDHVNPAETLDNRRVNLRIADRCQNQSNRGANRNNTSGFKGVSWHKNKKKWGAWIGSNGKSLHLGWFSTPELAHSAYCEAALRLHGEFARTA